MTGLSDEEIEQRIKALEAKMERLSAREQQAWGLVLAFLDEQRRAVGQQSKSLDRARDGLRELGE